MSPAKQIPTLIVLVALYGFNCAPSRAEDGPPEQREEALAPLLPPVCSNLLSNPGFESLTTSWSTFGSATTVAGFAHSGARAAKVDGLGSVLNQRVRVFGGQSYLLRQQLRGQYGGETARVQVNWYDSFGNFLAVNWLKPQLTTRYQQFRMVVTAPLRAGYAEIYANANAGQGVIYADDLSFTRTHHLRHHAYWYTESDWFGHFMSEDAVKNSTNLVYLNVASFTGGWNDLSGFRAALQKAARLGLQAIVDLSDAVYAHRGDPAGLSSALDRYAAAVAGSEYAVFANYMDEPDGAGLSSTELATAIDTIKARPGFAGVPMFITYIFSNPQEVPAQVDIVGVDPYPSTASRFDFEQTAYERLSRARFASKGRDIFLIGRAFDRPYNPTGTEQWFYELAFNDPQIIGLGWFSYTDGNDSSISWRGARSYPSQIAAHQHFGANIFCDNILQNPGFEEGYALPWVRYGGGGESSSGPNLLLNGDFDAATASWTQFGAPGRVGPPLTYSGTAAAKADVANGFTQRVSVRPLKTYQLRQWMRGVSGGELGRVQINWLDGSGRLLKPDIIRPTLTTSYASYTLTTAAPSLASLAEIYVTSDRSGEWALVDKIEFLSNPTSVSQGSFAAIGDAINGYTQRVSVEGGRTYRLEQWLRGLNGGETGRVQVNWHSSAGTFLSSNILRLPLPSTGWSHQQIDVAAPGAAQTAEIYVSSDIVGSRIIVDDLAFVRRD